MSLVSLQLVLCVDVYLLGSCNALASKYTAVYTFQTDPIFYRARTRTLTLTLTLTRIVDPKKDKLSLGVKINDSPLAQTKVIFTVRPKKLGSMPRVKNNIMTKELTETTGKFRYIGEGEGELEVCVRITEMPGKKYIKPALIGFRITESGELDEENIEAKPGLSPKEKETQDKAKTHLSEMERIMNHMIRETNLLLKNADLIKTDEAAFQKQSEEMNAASRWWPMLHVVVLLAMGFTQSNHVVKFFKGKHII